MRSKPWKEHDTPAERIAERRLHAVLLLQPMPIRLIARWLPEERRVVTGHADESRRPGACRWRRVLRIKALIRLDAARARARRIVAGLVIE